jgi:predicted DNA-binding protein
MIVISFKAPPQLKEKLKKYSEIFGVSVSDLIRLSIERYIKEREEEARRISIVTIRREISRHNDNNNEKKIKRNIISIEL